jgi:hypothetical protein
MEVDTNTPLRLLQMLYIGGEGQRVSLVRKERLVRSMSRNNVSSESHSSIP